MGLLDGLDRRNQETLEYHNDLDHDDVVQDVSAGKVAGIWIGCGVGLNVGAALFGTVPVVVAALATTVIVAGIGLTGYRRRRRLWLESRDARRADRNQ